MLGTRWIAAITLVTAVMTGCGGDEGDGASTEPTAAPSGDINTGGDAPEVAFEVGFAEMELTGDVDASITAGLTEDGRVDEEGIVNLTYGDDAGDGPYLSFPAEVGSHTTDIKAGTTMILDGGGTVFQSFNGECTIEVTEMVLDPDNAAVAGTFACTQVPEVAGSLSADATGSFDASF